MRTHLGRRWLVTLFLVTCAMGFAVVPSERAEAASDQLVVKPLMSRTLPTSNTPVAMAMTGDGSTLYVIATDSTSGGDPQVYRISTRTGDVLAQQAIPASSASPRASVGAIAVDGTSSRVWVAVGATLIALDGNTLALLGSWVNWDAQYEALVADASGSRVYGLTIPMREPTRLIELDAATGQRLRVAEITPPDRQTGLHRWIANRMVLDPSGQTIYAVPSDSRDLVAVRAADLGIQGRVEVGEEPTSVALSPTAGRAFVSDPFLALMYQVDTASWQVVGTSPLPGRCPSWLATDTLGERAVVGNPCGGDPVWVFDPRNGQTLNDDIKGNGMSVWMSPDGSAVYDISSGIGGPVNGYRLLTPQQAKAEQARLLPGQPVRIDVKVSESQAVVTWQAPSLGKGGGVLRYEVSTKPGGATCSSVGPDRRCVVGGLSPGQVYAFAVKARNAAGWGPRGVSRYVVMPRPATPAPTPKPSPSFS
jgi:outer membrane protein assembly factor BamB